MELTQTPADIQADIVGLMESEIAGGRKNRLPAIPQGWRDLFRPAVAFYDGRKGVLTWMQRIFLMAKRKSHI